jgi:hypothetical protein
MPEHDDDEHLPFRERLACSIEDAVTASGLSRSGLYEAMAAGQLEYLKHGRRRLIRVPSLLKMLDDT